MEYLNDLINAAQVILKTGFDVEAFLIWKEAALLTLLGLLGPGHYYTETFRQVTSEHDYRSLLAGEGVLVAANEQILKKVNDGPPNCSEHQSS